MVIRATSEFIVSQLTRRRSQVLVIWEQKAGYRSRPTQNVSAKLEAAQHIYTPGLVESTCEQQRIRKRKRVIYSKIIQTNEKVSR